MKKILVLILVLAFATPCFAVLQSAKVTKNNDIAAPVKEQELTLGMVQKYVHIGMTQDEVAIALGSPNIVTQDANGKETWIYDKMASSLTDRCKCESARENASYIRNGWHDVLTLVTLGLINRNVKPELKDVSQVVSSQKTLTILIKFDNANKVESFTYHMSKF